MNKSKVMINGEHQNLRQKASRWPYSVCDRGIEARIRIEWNKFRQLVPLLTSVDVSLFIRGRQYCSCVRSSMLCEVRWHVSEQR